MIKVCKFDEIKNDVQRFLVEQSLIPIFGSGVTYNAQAYKGRVPTGKMFREYMLNLLLERKKFDKDDQEVLNNYDFSRIANLYEDEEKITDTERREYIKNSFWRVQLKEPQSNILEIDWPYIYTLNIDDGIEENSKFKQVVCAFDDVDERIFDEAKCVIKLHGDVNKYLTSRGKLIFSKKAYIDSIQNNRALLNRIENDMSHQNIVYIGCSLDDELDLRATTSKITNDDINFRFYFTVDEPSSLKKDELKTYGITHIVLFSSYDDIYISLYKLWKGAIKISKNNFNDCKLRSIKQIVKFNDPENISYFFWGKNLIYDKREAVLPYYFIERKITNEIIKQVLKKNFVLVRGYSCTGKTYILLDVCRKLRSKDVYYLQSKELIHNNKFKELINIKHSVLIADDMALSSENLDYIINNLKLLKENDIHILYAVSYKNNEIFNIMQLLKKEGCSDIEYISDDIKIQKKLNKNETKQLNEKINKCNIGTFSEEQNIIDNILNIAKKLDIKSQYNNLIPKISNCKDIAVLIVLAIRKKVFVKECSDLGLYAEMKKHSSILNPVIDEERTEGFERSPQYNSNSKFVLNGETYLVDFLRQLSRRKQSEMIPAAYEYLITQLVASKLPTVDYSDTKIYKDFIYLDNINYLFGSKDEMQLIRAIYDRLQGILASDPSYKHQRAKCEILSAKYANDVHIKCGYYKKAIQYVAGAIMIYEKRYEENNNEKINISLQHAKYTQALAYCNLCILRNYEDDELNSKALKLTYEAFLTSYNSFEFSRKNTVNYNKAIENMINNMAVKTEKLDRDTKEYLIWLMNKKREMV